MNQLSNRKITLAKAAATGATTVLNSDWIDVSNAESVLFHVRYGTGHASNNHIKVQQATSSTGANAADLAGSKVLATTAKKEVIVEIVKPVKQYARCVMTRATSSSLGDCWAHIVGQRVMPVSVGSGQNSAIKISPSTGTA